MNYRVVHCCDLNTLPLGFLLAKVKRAYLVYDSFERYPEMHRGVLPQIFVRLLHFLEFILVRSCDAILAVSPAMASDLQRISGKNVTVIRNTAEREEYARLSDDFVREERRRLGLADRELVIAYIGIYGAERMIDKLICAVRGKERVKAIIVGNMEGSGIPELANEAPNVTYVGWVEPNKIPLYTCVQDVIYHVLDPDSPQAQARYLSPNALYDAMAAGRAIIATGVGELGQLIRETGCGLILENVDTRAIARAIDNLANDPQYLRSLWHSASVASQKYNWEHTERELLRVYERLT